MSWLKKQKKFKKGQDVLFASKGMYVVFVRSVPNNRLCPHNCTDFTIEIENDFLWMRYKTVLKDAKEFVYMLEETFEEGRLVIHVNEKTFHKCLLSIKFGFFALYDKRSIQINNTLLLPIKGYHLERRY